MYPKNIQNVINVFSRLPGIGPKTAERLVFYLLDNHLDEFSYALQQINGSIQKCTQCLNFSTHTLCAICGNTQRDAHVIAVVAKPQDVVALERSHEFNGTYHILGGLLSPISGITAEQLSIRHLESRITNPQNPVKEIILAFDNTVEGESTALFLVKQLKQYNITISRLARGLPIGSDVEYADEITLRDALKHRQTL